MVIEGAGLLKRLAHATFGDPVRPPRGSTLSKVCQSVVIHWGFAVSESTVLPPPMAAAKLNDQGKFAEARDLVADMVAKREQRPNAFIQMSRALRGLKEDAAARDVEQRAVELFPNDVWVSYHVGTMLNGDKEHAKAAALLAKPLASGNNEPLIFVALSIAQRALGHNDEAEALELKAVGLHPTHAGVVGRRAIVLNEAKRFDEVIKLFEGKDALVQSTAWLKPQLERAHKGLAERVSAVKPTASAEPPRMASAAQSPSIAAPPIAAPADRPAASPVREVKPPQAPLAGAVIPAAPPAAAAVAQLNRPETRTPPQASPPSPPPREAPRSGEAASAVLARVAQVPSAAPAVQRSAEAPAQPPRMAPSQPAPQSAARPEMPRSAADPARGSSVSAAGDAARAAAHAGHAQVTKRPEPAAPATTRAPRRSGPSGFVVLLLGLLVAGIGLAIAHVAGLVDLAPLAHELSKAL